MTTVIATNVALVGHLMRRAGFALPAHELERLAKKSYEALVDDLVDFEKFDPVDMHFLERYHSEYADGEGWTPLLIMYRMINSKRPLQEKMALMWHGVFATGTAKVTNGPMMLRHYEMLREFAVEQLCRNLEAALPRPGDALLARSTDESRDGGQRKLGPGTA